MAVLLKQPIHGLGNFYRARHPCAGQRDVRYVMEVRVVINEMQSHEEKLQRAAKEFSAALEEAKRAGLQVTLERSESQPVTVRCGPLEPAHDHDDGGGPLWGVLV